MLDSESNDNEEFPELTTKLVVRILSGKANAAEKAVYRRALRNPHSPLYDWLESASEKMQGYFGRKSEAELAADELLMPNDRNDLIAFARRQHAEKRLSDEQLSKILAAGALDVDEVSSTPQTYARATQRMLDSIHQLAPEVMDELNTLLKQRERRGPG